MNSKRSRLDADAFQENCTSNKRRVPDSSDGDTSVSPDGEGHFGELALISFQWYVEFHRKIYKQWPPMDAKICKLYLSACRVSSLIIFTV